MARKDDVSLEKLKSLCDFKNDQYISKRGNAYISSLKAAVNLNNKNDIPFTLKDVKQQPELNNFDFEGVTHYKYICKLQIHPMTIKNDKRKNEKIKAVDFADDQAELIFKNSMGVSYIFTMPINGKEHIIKIGQTRKTFKERLESYNCGYMYNWRTASTTNIKIMQSLVVTRKDMKLYLFDCSDEPYSLEWCGEKSPNFASPKALAVENIMLKKFYEKFNQKPLANVQTELKNGQIEVEDDEDSN